MGFSVQGDKIFYTTFIWTHQGLKQEKSLSGIFTSDAEKLFEEIKLKVMENPKTFGYDHTFWMSPQEEQTYAEQIQNDKSTSQNMPTEMLN